METPNRNRWLTLEEWPVVPRIVAMTVIILGLFGLMVSVGLR